MTDFTNSLAQPIQYTPMDIGFDPSKINLNLPGSQDATYGVNPPGGMVQGPDGGWNFSDAMSNFSTGAQGLMGLACAYNAYKQTGLLEDQLAMQKAMANRNLSNQAATTNLGLSNQAQAAAQMYGHAPGSAGYDEYIKQNQVQVSGAPI